MNKRTETNRIIFHHSLSDFGDVDIIRSWHKEKGYSDIGYHFVVPKEGPFLHGRKMALVGAHAKGKNSDSIGVCIVGDFSKYEPSVHQLEECIKLYHDICRVYNKQLVIEFHHELCPGKLLDREDFLEIVYRGWMQ